MTREAPRPALTVFTVLGPPTLWFAHLNFVYPIPDVACSIGSSWPFHVATLAALVGIAIAGVAGWRRRSGSFLADPRDPDAAIADRDTFLGWFGVASAALFGMVVVMAHIAVVVVDPCMH